MAPVPGPHERSPRQDEDHEPEEEERPGAVVLGRADDDDKEHDKHEVGGVGPADRSPAARIELHPLPHVTQPTGQAAARRVQPSLLVASGVTDDVACSKSPPTAAT